MKYRLFLSHLAAGAVGGMLVVLCLAPHFVRAATDDGKVYDRIRAKSFELFDKEGNAAGYFSCTTADGENLPKLFMGKGSMTVAMGLNTPSAKDGTPTMAAIILNNATPGKESTVGASLNVHEASILVKKGPGHSQCATLAADDSGPNLMLVSTKAHIGLLDASKDSNAMVMLGNFQPNKNAQERPVSSIVVLDKSGNSIWSVPR